MNLNSSCSDVCISICNSLMKNYLALTRFSDRDNIIAQKVRASIHHSTRAPGRLALAGGITNNTNSVFPNMCAKAHIGALLKGWGAFYFFFYSIKSAQNRRFSKKISKCALFNPKVLGTLLLYFQIYLWT